MFVNEDYFFEGNTYVTLEPSIRYTTLFVRSNDTYNKILDKINQTVTNFNTSNQLIYKKVNGVEILGLKNTECNATTNPIFG